MINKLSRNLVKILLLKHHITEEDEELYVYGLFMLFSQFIYFIITCVIGLLFNCILESIIFYVAFQFIRKYAGGYHASTEIRCEIMTTLSITLCIFVIRLSKTYNFQTAVFLIAFLSAICIFVLGPLDTPEKPLSKKEFKYFRKVSRIILIIIVSAIIISYFAELNLLFAPCCMSLVLESILIIAGKIKKVSQKRKVIQSV